MSSSERLFTVSISVRRVTHTYQGLINRKAFSENLYWETAYFGSATGRKSDKFAVSGLTSVRSQLVDAPYIEEFPINLECRVIESHELGSYTQFVGEIVSVKADDTFDESLPLIKQLRPMIYGAGDDFTYYTLGRKINARQR